MKRGVVVIVFSRVASPGRVKTRLAGRLGPWGAARLHARLTRRALATARASGVGILELHGTPRARSPGLVALATQFGASLHSQRGGDLGARMHRALAHALRLHRAAILIGSDCPALRAQDLRQAARLLRAACDTVLSPTEDGGYALIGARRTSPALFAGVEWGGPAVYTQSARRLDAAGLRWRALRRLWDVDRPDDLERLRSLRFSAASPPRARR